MNTMFFGPDGSFIHWTARILPMLVACGLIAAAVPLTSSDGHEGTTRIPTRRPPSARPSPAPCHVAGKLDRLILAKLNEDAPAP